MRHDLLILSGASLVLGLVTWALWGNPHCSVPRSILASQLAADPNLKLVSEGSPYMRNER